MAKLTLSDLSAFVNSGITLTNANWAAIEAAIENTLSRDGTSPNAMGADFDMDSNRIINLGAPGEDNDAVRLVDLSDSDATGAASAQLRIDLLASSGASLIGFLQAGAGAIARTVQAKERDVVNVADFGENTVPGTTDMTSAINAAIAAMPTIGGTLEYDGVLLISSTITVNKKIRVRGRGGRGPNNSDLPSSYFKMASSMTTTGIKLTAQGAILEGGGVVATLGATGGGVELLANGCTVRDFSALGAAGSGVGIRVGQDADGGNSNSWKLDNCNSSNWGSHGFYISDSPTSALSDANAGSASGCTALLNGGDGFRNYLAHHNTYSGCLGESNTGYGFNMMAEGFNNWIIGGDFEANTAGQVIFQTGSRLNGHLLDTGSISITDNGYYTRTLGNYSSKKQAYTPCFVGSGTADVTITAVTISGTTCTSTAAAHGYSNGDMVWIRAHAAGRTNLNGAYVISNVTANTFDYTFRSDVEYATPTTGSGLSALAKRSGVYTSAKGWYQYNDGRVHFNARLITSALTGLSGTIQLLLPVATTAFNGSEVYGHASLQYYAGITHSGNLALLLTQDGAINPSFYDTIGSTLTPAQFQVAGLAAASTVIISGWYWV